MKEEYIIEFTFEVIITFIFDLIIHFIVAFGLIIESKEFILSFIIHLYYCFPNILSPFQYFITHLFVQFCLIHYYVHFLHLLILYLLNYLFSFDFILFVFVLNYMRYLTVCQNLLLYIDILESSCSFHSFLF